MNEQEIREIIRDELASERNEIPNVREIIRDELEGLIKTDRYTFEKDLELFDGRNIQLPKKTGAKIGTASDEKLAFYGTTPVDQPDAVSDANSASVSDGGDTTTNSTINSNFNALDSKINTLIDRLQELGLLK